MDRAQWDEEVEEELNECERLEELARSEEAIAELRESMDSAYDEHQKELHADR